MRTFVDSSFIDWVEYNESTYTLRVSMKGRTYRYVISPVLYKAFLAAESIGRFYNTRIKRYIQGEMEVRREPKPTKWFRVSPTGFAHNDGTRRVQKVGKVLWYGVAWLNDKAKYTQAYASPFTTMKMVDRMVALDYAKDLF